VETLNVQSIYDNICFGELVCENNEERVHANLMSNFQSLAVKKMHILAAAHFPPAQVAFHFFTGNATSLNNICPWHSLVRVSDQHYLW
jgi:hypothetical protein